MILLHFDGEKQREIQTNFQVKQSGSRQIRKKKHLGLFGVSVFFRYGFRRDEAYRSVIDVNRHYP